jgi:hypothetical protein
MSIGKRDYGWAEVNEWATDAPLNDFPKRISRVACGRSYVL